MNEHQAMWERIEFMLRKEGLADGNGYRAALRFLLDRLKDVGHWHGAKSGHLPADYVLCEVAYWTPMFGPHRAICYLETQELGPEGQRRVWVEWDQLDLKPSYGQCPFDFEVLFWRELPPLPTEGINAAQRGGLGGGHGTAESGGHSSSHSGGAADQAHPPLAGDGSGSGTGGGGAAQEARPAAPVDKGDAAPAAPAGRRLPPARPIGQ